MNYHNYVIFNNKHITYSPCVLHNVLMKQQFNRILIFVFNCFKELNEIIIISYDNVIINVFIKGIYDSLKNIFLICIITNLQLRNYISSMKKQSINIIGRNT